MAWTFRKKIKIIPGIYLNISKNGFSTSIGPKGAKVIMSSKGTYLHTGIPGTGLYSRQKLGTAPQSHASFASNDLETNKLSENKGCLKTFIWVLFLFSGLLIFGGILSISDTKKNIQVKTAEYNQLISSQNSGENANRAEYETYSDSRTIELRSEIEELQNSLTPCYILLAFFTILFIFSVIWLAKRIIFKKLKSSASVEAESEKTEIASASTPITKNQPNPAIEKIAILFANRGITDPMIEQVATFCVQMQSVSTSMLQRKFAIGYNRAGRIMTQLEESGIVGSQNGVFTREVFVKDMSELDYIFNYKKPEHTTLNVSNSEDTVTPANSVKKSAAPKRISKKTHSNTAKELDNLIGLTSVKSEITALTNYIKVQKLREEKGMKVTPVSLHCVFTGNPGTGKTTVARIVSEIYKELGLLKRGHLVETDRSGLVAEYVGQTAAKTNKIIDSALDGILFIDEAYSLINGSNSDYGKEAIATLLKRMEDDRNRLVVILAGYTNDMKLFIDSNPGLQSRFNRYIEFSDYSADELYQIFYSCANKYEYIIADDAQTTLKEVFEKAVADKDKNFGNGRFVRNLFEKVIEHQANRLSSEADISAETLATIKSEDIPNPLK